MSLHLYPLIVPLGGNRRRFGPAPVEETAPDGSRAKEESFSTGTATPGKSTITYLLRCIVRIGDSETLFHS